MNESTAKFKSRATWTRDLSQSERRFVAAMNELGFGRFELLRIKRGELVLDPWPKTVRLRRFVSEAGFAPKELGDEFELKPPVAELIEYVRGVDEGDILCLEVRHGLPVSLETTYRPGISRSSHS